LGNLRSQLLALDSWQLRPLHPVALGRFERVLNYGALLVRETAYWSRATGGPLLRALTPARCPRQVLQTNQGRTANVKALIDCVSVAQRNICSPNVTVYPKATVVQGLSFPDLSRARS